MDRIDSLWNAIPKADQDLIKKRHFQDAGSETAAAAGYGIENDREACAKIAEEDGHAETADKIRARSKTSPATHPATQTTAHVTPQGRIDQTE